MAQVTYSFRMDEGLKRQADLFCNDVGMNLSTMLMVCLKRIIRENRFPFEISAEPNYNEITRQAIADVNAGVGLSPRYSSWAEAKAALEAEIDAEDDDA
ncbi:MAG: type II toxin-antitoxin system RelB/DinJ family antitoxin [Oscillospiraceae bacterium]|nr:type II toxin-antitoxin system RelB/DinJ family antitoxin [Oscillospiraceae bacterium]